MTAPTARTLARIETVRILRNYRWSNAAIATRLGVSERTVERYAQLARQHPARRAATTTWEKRAACKGASPDQFFLIAYQARRDDVQAAKQICRTCPVMRECRDWALDNPFLAGDGIWGGMTPPERARARQARQQTEGTAA